MVHEENKLNYGIKGKLISAIAMLLVAVIMVVSSTYAWFTLSTAPEVSGINTAVGANGALEMLLLTTDDNGFVYHDGRVDGFDRNTYWGNLVDLTKKDGQDYGTDKITLYPSVLLEEDNTISLMTPVAVPEYGADGRVSGLKNGTFGTYSAQSGTFKPVGVNGADDPSGFRALGVASGLSDRAQAYRSAVSAFTVAQSAALRAARNSLEANGTPLAAIAVKKAMQGESATYDEKDIAAVNNMIAGLKASLQQVEEAYVQAAIIYVLAADSSITTDTEALAKAKEISDAVAAVNSGELNAKFEAAATVLDWVDVPLTGYTTYSAALANYTAAANASGSMTTTWASISPVLTKLVNIDLITINNYTVSEVKDHTNEIASSVTSGNGVKVNIPTGGGIYADIADLCGSYTVDAAIDSGDLGVGVTGIKINAKMTAASTVNPTYLTQYKNLKNEPSSVGGDNPITEFYGYVIDLAFRTNAAQSDLLLQTAAKDRIYSDNNNTETMGHGSTMTFSTNDANFSLSQMIRLMGHIRVVFFDPSSGNIYARAQLDTAENSIIKDANGVTASIKLLGEDGALINDVKEAKIISLNQNVAHNVSVLVYLDGTTISNADVAATAAQSMSGTVNFQFASSAELVPMQYGDLYTPAN